MKELKIKQSFEWVKQSVAAMPKKKKIIIGSISAAVIIFAILLTVMLNGNKDTYRILFPGMSTSETSDIYPVLKDMGANPKLSATGEVMVLNSEYDIWLLQMTAKGYPRTTLTYDIYGENSGITTTDAEQQQWKVYQLQELIQGTLKRLAGVESATVLINMPKTSPYVWDTATNVQKATAGVTLNLREGVILDSQQITTIKNLIASSIPNMDPADVTVVDAATMMELTPDNPDQAGITVAENWEYEQIVQNQLESNIVRLLTPRYGNKGVVAAAKVTLNYDKMISEQLQLEEKPLNEDGTGGGGYMTHTDGSYGMGGDETIGGIVGEEDNTDIPNYSYVTPGEDGDATYYRWNTDFDYSYLKTQIEKGNAKIDRATVSVMVDEKNLTQARRDELVDLISRSVDIAPDLVSVSAYTPDTLDPQDPQLPEVDVPATNPLATILEIIPLWALIAAGGLLILLIVLFIILANRRKRKKKHLADLALEQENAARQQIEDEISQYKKNLTSAANAGKDPKDDAILTEIRDFAKINPEITASLLRSWLKEVE